MGIEWARASGGLAEGGWERDALRQMELRGQWTLWVQAASGTDKRSFIEGLNTGRVNKDLRLSDFQWLFERDEALRKKGPALSQFIKTICALRDDSTAWELGVALSPASKPLERR